MKNHTCNPAEKSNAYKVFIRILSSISVLILISVAVVFASRVCIALILGAPKPGNEVINALTDGDAERSLKLALKFKEREYRAHNKNQMRKLHDRIACEYASDLLSRAYELNGNFEKAYDELLLCRKSRENRYRFAYLEYRTGRRTEAFEDYAGIAIDIMGVGYREEDPETQKRIRLKGWEYISAQKYPILYDFEKQTFPFKNCSDFCTFMDEMFSLAKDRDQYELEMSFWHDLCSDLDTETTQVGDYTKIDNAHSNHESHNDNPLATESDSD